MTSSCRGFDFTIDGYDPQDERRRESLFAVGNGRLFVRASAPQAGPDEHRYPGTYHAGLYDCQASDIEGVRVHNTSLVKLPDWLPLSFRVDGDAEWFSLERVEVLGYRMTLDMEQGVSNRDMMFRDRRGRLTRLREQRLASMVQPALVALRLEITAQDWSGRLEVRSALDGTVLNTNVRRYRPYESRHIEVTGLDSPQPDVVRMRVRTRQSGIDVALAARTRILGAEPASRRPVIQEGVGIAHHVEFDVLAGHVVAIEKQVAIVASQDALQPVPREAALTAVQNAPDFDGLQAAQAHVWSGLWRRAAVEAEDEGLSRTVRFQIFHLLQTVSPNSIALDAGFPARGWQEAYHGQIFWDEIFAFPFLNARFPESARALLMYRYRRLPAARDAARQHGYRGAMYPWRSAQTGEEETPCFQLNLLSGDWMRDHTRLQRHIGCAIAYNVWSYFLATGDIDFLCDQGAEMLIEIARFWASIARFDASSGRYEIRGVIGPDEYHNAYPGAASPGLDNNAYTNVMAVWTLCRAIEALDRLPAHWREALCRSLRLESDELATWDRISRKMTLLFHGDGIISQFEGFDRLDPLDCERLRREHPGQRLDWLLQARGDSMDRYQITKQADVLMLLYLLRHDELIALAARLGYRLNPDQLAATADYYLQRISHESSLSRVVCAGALASIDPAVSWRHFQDAMRNDIEREHSTSTDEGLHLGAMAGTLDVVQRHYLGLDLRDTIVLRPTVAARLGPMRLGFLYRNGRFELESTGRQLHLRSPCDNPADVTVSHRDGSLRLRPGEAFTLDLDRA